MRKPEYWRRLWKAVAKKVIAVPQYYNNQLQLLVPLCLQTPGIPDLALTCSKTEDKSKYMGHTCLTLEMAYNNARLIAKPDTNWLRV